MNRPPNKSGGQEAAAKDRAAQPDVLRELSNWLRAQFLRHDVLFNSLGNESDKLAAARFARFALAVDEARRDALPPWLNGNELLALARKGKKEVRSCR